MQVDQKGPYIITYPDAWQPLEVNGNVQLAATPHWGRVYPFAPLPEVPPPFPLYSKEDPASLYRIQVSYYVYIFPGCVQLISSPNPGIL